MVRPETCGIPFRECPQALGYPKVARVSEHLFGGSRHGVRRDAKLLEQLIRRG